MDCKTRLDELPDPPAAILELNDPVARDITIDIWRAASRLFAAIDIWREWLHEFAETGDADPAIAMNLMEVCKASIATLSSHCSSRFFPDRDVEDVEAMLPPIPLYKDWQGDRRFIMRLAQSGEQSYELQGACSLILSQLQQQPTTVLRDSDGDDALLWYEPGRFRPC